MCLHHEGWRLGVSKVPSTCPDFHFEKTGEKDFWHHITCDEIITDYNTKAVNVDAITREGTTIVTQQEKVTK